MSACLSRLVRLLLTPLVFSLYSSVDLHAQSRFGDEGRLVVDEATRTLTLDRGPIPGLTSAIRREFPVQQVELLRGLKVSCGFPLSPAALNG